MAIHDFIKHIELYPSLSERLSYNIKTNRDLGILTKYGHLKQIYQGIEDTNADMDDDLGHERYSIVRDLKLIQNKETFDRNVFWKKRETFRKFTIQIYERLDVQLLEVNK